MSARYGCVIRGGTLVTAADTVRADLAVQGERIAALGDDLDGKTIIDARGLLVLPGGIDPHVHLQMPTGTTTSSDTWQTGTIAAACGGTTTLIDFVEPIADETLAQALAARQAEAHGEVVIDYGLHMTLTNARPSTLAGVAGMVEAGITSFKTYTTYDGFKLADDEFLAVMQAVRDAGGMTITHCENDAIMAHLTAQHVAAGHTAPAYHPLSRPALAEAEAIQRVLTLAAITDVPAYIVHVSSAPGAAAVRAARVHRQAAYGETCPQYLLLDDALYSQPDFGGAKYICSPPLRTAADQAALWDALTDGSLQTVGTDHCPFNFVGQKDLGRGNFTAVPGGLPGVEARLALLYSTGVRTGRLSLNQWVAVCSTNAACLFGLYPRKGTLLPGADADLVLFDPNKSVTLTTDVLHENVDYTPYEGISLHGYPVLTMSRGTVLVKNGQFIGPHGHGRYIKRHSPVHMSTMQGGNSNHNKTELP
jgi:dihydropyrimidinase